MITQSLFAVVDLQSGRILGIGPTQGEAAFMASMNKANPVADVVNNLTSGKWKIIEGHFHAL